MDHFKWQLFNKKLKDNWPNSQKNLALVGKFLAKFVFQLKIYSGNLQRLFFKKNKKGQNREFEVFFTFQIQLGKGLDDPSVTSSNVVKKYFEN